MWLRNGPLAKVYQIRTAMGCPLHGGRIGFVIDDTSRRERSLRARCQLSCTCTLDWRLPQSSSVGRDPGSHLEFRRQPRCPRPRFDRRLGPSLSWSLNLGLHFDRRPLTDHRGSHSGNRRAPDGKATVPSSKAQLIRLPVPLDNDGVASASPFPASQPRPTAALDPGPEQDICWDGRDGSRKCWIGRCTEGATSCIRTLGLASHELYEVGYILL